MSKFGFVRLFALSCVLFSLNPSIFAQGARVNPSGAGEDADRDDPAARDRWFMQGRVAPKGKTPAELRWHAYQQKIQMRAARIVAARRAGIGTAARPDLAAVGTAWAPLGPAPLASDPGSGQDYGFVSGRATSVVIDTADATGNTVYLGGAYGGVWRSKNAGSLSSNPSSVAWTPLTDTQPTLAVGAIALQPCSVSLNNCDGLNHLSKTVLVGTGEPNSAIDSYYGLGILRSIDGGNNWSLVASANGGVNSFKGLGFSKIAFNTTTGKENNVVAATASTIGNQDGARVSGQIAGPFVSMDSGATWAAAPVSDGAFGGAVAPISSTSVAFNANAGPSGTFYMAMRYHGFYSSPDGTNWTRLAKQPAPAGGGINSSVTCPTSGNTNCPIYRGEIAVVQGRNEMYVWYTDGNDTDQGIWQSTDGGGSWTKLDDTNITNCGDPNGCGTVQGFYDLELAAVAAADGISTDLYAGTRNLYKCTLGNPVTTASCSGTGTSSFQNLTHVYNCSQHPTVHPDQHGISSLLVGGTDVLYFATDGGIYRALDGFTGLVTNSCVTNQFSDLNASLGSMTQFVSFSLDPANSTILLGGTQDNGSPATSQTNTNWRSVNGGDGGYNEIDPSNPNNWYTANTNISIWRCTAGTACDESAFALLVDSAHLGGDSSAFYAPYMLDPQNSNELLVGTCRVWRGSSTGTGFVAISPNFDQRFATICADPKTSIVNFVHAIAAGGPVGINGFSKVVYAGLAGFGPLSSATPLGGRVWVTNDSSANPIGWSDITPPANQSTSYTIGDIAMDPSDATGATAFLALQGFGAMHVLKTTNGGTWTDFSGSLPNAPANSLLIDSSTNTVYVGTDVGVFTSTTSSPVWTEVGPAPSSGTAGYLPDAPVTKLRLFSGGGARILRASTYGRGIWEFVLVAGPPSFTVMASPATVTAYSGQTATFNGTLTSVNGYAGTVTLSCGSGAPATCTPPGPIALSAGASVSFNVAASNPIPAPPFSFDIHGTDGTLTSDQPVVLDVVNFAISAPNPATIAANVPNTSNATNFQITGQGSFADAVTLSCTGLPTGASCNFVPSAIVQPTSVSPAAVTLTISTSPATCPMNPCSPATVTLTVHDSTNPEPTPKTQTLTLNITANPDYALAVSNSPQSTTVLGSGTFNGTVTAVNGYLGGTVTVTCGTGAPATCAPPTTPIPLAAGGSANFMVTASSPTVGTFNFNIHGTDGTTPHDVPVALTVNADFHVPSTVVTCTPVAAGGTSTCSIPIGPDGQATFASNVTYPCPTTGFPNLSFCTFNPVSIPSGSAATTVVLSVHTTQAVASLRPTGPFQPSAPLLAFWLSLPALGIVSLGAQRPSRKPLAGLAGTLLVVALAGFLTACGGSGGGGGGGQPGTAKGTYTFNVDATSNGITHSAPMTLTVN